ncbi:MAG: hypothetical protein H3C29_03245 [Simplicispira suum]|uniref:hypothetical protein n=1 Tax=Simplicispira suum TaxID=2109915 RepID=UPI001C6ADA50|nr:hypothetical protein [Simplicispira suum]MBW7832208.1 hypothetical protein [Simplicispira suum]
MTADKGMTAGKGLARAAWIGLWLALFVALWVWAWPKQIERGCWLAEWPFEQGCSDYASGNLETTTPTQQVQHLERNIGDGFAYLELTQNLAAQDDSLAAPLLPWLQQLAPHNNRALALQANASLRAEDYEAAAKALALLVERGVPSARAPLVALMLEPSTQDAVRAQLTAQSRWLDPTLASLGAQVPVELLQPFVNEGWKLGVVRLPTALGQVERLKKAGYWLDAYALWVAVLGQVQDGLYNPGFDRRASQRGFDWSWPQQRAGKVGVQLAQVSAAPRTGSMLQVEMTGRGALPQPVASQPLVLLGSHYRFTGRYMSDRLRTREGLVWALRCAAGGERFAQTEALVETQKQWQSFDLEFDMPAECEGAARLQLEAMANWEARAGMAGVMYFDDFELRQRAAESVQ